MLAHGIVLQLMPNLHVVQELHHHQQDYNNLDNDNHYQPNDKQFDVHVNYNLATIVYIISIHVQTHKKWKKKNTARTRENVSTLS